MIESRLARSDGGTLAYTLHPGTGGTPLVLVHGLASNRTRFAEFAEHSKLGGLCPMLRVDLRGHGGSLTRRRIDMALWCDDLAALLDAEGLAQAIVVGHSLGAQVALHFARRHLGRTAGLVLIDPVFRGALRGRWRHLARAVPLLRLGAAAVRGLNALGLRRGALPPLDLRELDALARQSLRSAQDEAAFIRRYSSARADLRHVPLAVYLQDLAEMFSAAPAPRELQCPMLALLSSGATFADREVMRGALAGPRTTLHAIECQHWPLTERPAEVRAAIDSWCLANLPDPPGAPGSKRPMPG